MVFPYYIQDAAVDAEAAAFPDFIKDTLVVFLVQFPVVILSFVQCLSAGPAQGGLVQVPIFVEFVQHDARGEVGLFFPGCFAYPSQANGIMEIGVDHTGFHPGQNSGTEFQQFQCGPEFQQHVLITDSGLGDHRQ